MGKTRPRGEDGKTQHQGRFIESNLWNKAVVIFFVLFIFAKGPARAKTMNHLMCRVASLGTAVRRLGMSQILKL